MKENEKRTLKETISIKYIVNLSIVDMIMLQLLLKHEKPIVRHTLYNEISQFLTREKKKVVQSVKFENDTPGATEFKDLLENDKKLSSSSFYNSLKNLENKGLVKSNKDDKDKIVSVEATQYTEILINTISKHVIRFGLIEAEQNKNFPDILKEVIEKNLLNQNEVKKFGTLLYISFIDFLNTKCMKILSKITKNLFVLSNKEVLEGISKMGLKNFQKSSIFNKTIRESDNFFDAVIIPYQIGSSDLYSITKGTILKEAFRIVKEKGVVIIHGYTELPIVEHGLLNIFIKWVKNFYSDLKTCSEEEFNEELLKAGARDVDVFLYRGYLFGIGRK